MKCPVQPFFNESASDKRKSFSLASEDEKRWEEIQQKRLPRFRKFLRSNFLETGTQAIRVFHLKLLLRVEC